MINVLIVDDERIIRDGISSLINWDQYGLVLIGKDSTGLDAYNRIMDETKTTPDIVITDIKMPIMNGLELIKKVSSQNNEIVFIILSGYGEFEFAKKAMEYGVRHYLLKPTTEDEIIKLLLEASHEVTEKKRINELIDINSVKKEYSGSRYGHTVNKIIATIDNNISNRKLSLKWIAEEVIYMNEDYLSKLFIKETGKKFTEYVTIKKMEKAKELIVNNPDLKLFDIAEKIGFDYNSRYFSQVFKKYTGRTPSEYKKDYFS